MSYALCVCLVIMCLLIKLILYQCANDVVPLCHTCACTRVLQLSGIPAFVHPWINGMTEVVQCYILYYIYSA